MEPLRVVVLGAGVSGLAAALALARAGHQITLVVRDSLEVGDALDSLDWARRGIPHFMQAHSFTSRGYKELREAFPDVLQALVDAGADDIDLARKLPGAREPGDEDLRMLGVRRPLIEWALRRAVLAEPNVRAAANTNAVGLHATEGEVPKVSGVRTSDGTIDADLVIDAMGRRSPVPGWITALGGTPMTEESSECGVIYYTRYYRVREGRSLPDGPWLPTPRADLGYGLFSTFPGDNGAFAGLVAIPPGDQDLKVLRHEAAFDAATALMPALWSWVNPETSTPITGVLPMGSLQNTLRTAVDGGPPAVGLISIGDALCHTDPVFALGLSFAFIEARELRESLAAHGADLDAAARAFDAALRPSMTERFRFATELDDLRLRRWTGESFDIAHRDGGAYPLFIMAAGTAAALVDASVFRAVVRRNYFLDPLSIVDADVEMQSRIERIFGELIATPRPPAGPTRSDLLEAMRTTLSGAA
jgi:2-polyprenyl-6-methoxyphenol hydroxylase-like FAD-dependent oxidoreductase